MPKPIKGGTLEHNASVGAKYANALEALVRMMVTETEREVKNLFRSDVAAEHAAAMVGDASIASEARKLTNKLAKKFQSHFAKRAKELAERMVANVDKVSKTALSASLKAAGAGLALPTDSLSGPLGAIVEATVVQNVDLIQSIASQYQTRVQGAVMRSITSGGDLQSLTDELGQIRGVTQRRAKNIALDQTRKAYNGINRGRMLALGIKKFEWLHSGGGQKPRPDHVEMSGKIYSFDKLPVIDEKTGERGIPGQAPNCRCRMVPVLEFEGGGDDAGE